jgi:hypothetical protein
MKKAAAIVALFAGLAMIPSKPKAPPVTAPATTAQPAPAPVVKPAPIAVAKSPAVAKPKPKPVPLHDEGASLPLGYGCGVVRVFVRTKAALDQMAREHGLTPEQKRQAEACLR